MHEETIDLQDYVYLEHQGRLSGDMLNYRIFNFEGK